MVTLSPWQVERFREIDAQASAIGDLLNSLRELARQDPQQIDARWIAIAQTELQQGFMALRRAVGNPKTF